jgi:hypothetical protein
MIIVSDLNIDFLNLPRLHVINGILLDYHMIHIKTQKHGNRSNVTNVVMLRNCRSSNEKKKWAGHFCTCDTSSELSIETDHTILRNLFNHCIICKLYVLPTIAWITSISIDMIFFFIFPRENFFAGFKNGRGARLTWLFIKSHVVSGDVSRKGWIRMLFTYSYV